MTPEELKNLITKYKLDQCTDEEKEWVEHWLDSLHTQSEDLSATEEVRIKASLQERIDTAIKEEENIIALPVRQFPVWRVASVILLVALAAGVGIWIGKGHFLKTSVAYMEIYNPPGRQKVIQLSDKSLVYMNADTRIRVPKSFSGNIRQVYLEGEAFFEVTKDPKKPFVITSGKINTRVLGTSFNVKAYKDDSQIEVAVRTGKVQVGDSMQTVFLTPNQKASYSIKEQLLTQTNVTQLENYTAWMEGNLVFEDKTLPEIIQILNRKYNVTIQLENKELSQCKLNARFKNEPLPRIVEKICLYLGARYKKVGNQIIIKGNTCQ
ncbi:FecR domain-containing protein [Cytophagaceae bacterium YF14B1]|uniref:FecR domain-containing protein n=1 Tax=Xanthocytophaga flava TaxID=3048013 RepID=A0AAE3QNK3_9BACT|nr:FecR domain-containing protein [Xanthocytophaga flavus]MDJ1480710.1 FecR domain-containing protein [Xanthocytophaga flavus]